MDFDPLTFLGKISLHETWSPYAIVWGPSTCCTYLHILYCCSHSPSCICIHFASLPRSPCYRRIVHCSRHTHDRYVAAINNTPPIAQARVERLPATRLRVRSHQSVKSSSSFGESREWSELLFHFERKIYWGSLLNFLMTTTTNWPYTT
jgi:hypothetical protein